MGRNFCHPGDVDWEMLEVPTSPAPAAAVTRQAANQASHAAVRRKQDASSTTDADPQYFASYRKSQKLHVLQSPGAATSAQSQMALVSITQLLIEAHGINTNAGSD